QELKDSIEKVSERLVKGSDAKINANSKADKLIYEIKTLKNNLIDPNSLICRACKRPLDDHNPEDIEKENSKVNEEIKQVDIKLEEVRSLQKKIDAGITKLNN